MHFRARRTLIDEALSVATSPKSFKNQFHSNMSKNFVLITRISQDQLVHYQVEEEIKQLKIYLKAIFEEAGVLPNTGAISNPDWSVLEILNYATPKRR